MGKVTISFHPSFLILVFIFVYFGWTFELLVYSIALLLHELGHYYTAKLLGYKLNKVLFMPYGVSLSGENIFFKRNHEIVIAVAGPTINLFLCLLCVAFWWVVPELYVYSSTFVFANLSLGLFNLLPLFPMDGGRVLLAFISKKKNKKTYLTIIKVLAYLMILNFVGLFIYSAFHKINLTFIFIAGFLFISTLDADKNIYFERSYKSLQKGSLNAIEIKSYAVSYKMPLIKLAKLIKGDYFVIFYVVDDNNKIVSVLTEKEVANKLELVCKSDKIN